MLKLISRRGFRNLNSRRSRNRAPRRVFYNRGFQSNAYVRRKLNYNFSSRIQTMGPVKAAVNITTTTSGNFNALNYAPNNNLYGFEEFLQKSDDFSLFKLDYIHVTVYPNQKYNNIPTVSTPLYIAMDWFGDRNLNFIYSDNVKIVTPDKVNVKHFTFRPINSIINNVNLREWTPIGVTIPGRLMFYSDAGAQDIWHIRIEYRVKFAYAKDHTPNQLKLEKVDFSILPEEPEEEKLEESSDEEEPKEQSKISKSFQSEIKNLASRIEEISNYNQEHHLSYMAPGARYEERKEIEAEIEKLKKERRKRRNQAKKKRKEKEEFLKDKIALKNIKKELEWNKEKYIKKLQEEIAQLKKNNEWLKIEYDLYHKRKDKNDKYKNYLDKKAEDLKAERKIIDEYHAARGRTGLIDENYRYNLMQQHFKENRRRKREGKSPLNERMVDIALKHRPTFGNDCSGYGINPIV